MVKDMLRLTVTGRFALLFLAMSGLWGCAESVSFAEAALKTPVGFWEGYWDGVTVLVSLFGSLFDDSIAIYAIYNNGAPYDWGFVMGISSLGIGSYFEFDKD